MAAVRGKSKDAVLDIQKWIEQPVRVKFTGGREVTGTLQGFDALVMADIARARGGLTATATGACSQ